MKQRVIRGICLTIFTNCIFSVAGWAQSGSKAFTPIEATIRKELKIPANAKRVVILSHDAHMDWDWLNAFRYNSNETGPVYDDDYFYVANRQPADTILSMATRNLLSSTAYYYSVCEMGFLRAFANHYPATFASMKNTGRLRTVGGGITSPDNLLPNGETFIRNFLVANQWLRKNNVPWSQQVWIPDDFGHDPQLPVMLQAMDAMGVGFARIPGACDGRPQSINTGQTTLLDTIKGGVDFKWAAADSSETIAHWLQAHYSQGADIETTDWSGSDYSSPADNLLCNGTTNNSVIAHIQAYISNNGPVSPTPYIFVEVSDDFMTPYQQLVNDAAAWNDSAAGYAATGVYAVVATFDHYIRLISQYPNQLRLRAYNPFKNGVTVQPFTPNPYWMGYYASRPELKTLHNKATRSLLAAETYQVISNTLMPVPAATKQAQIQQLLNAWDTLAPSTHHDFITGTAVDSVYKNEQLPILNKSVSLANKLKQQFMQDIVNKMSAPQPAVVVFNPLGFANNSVVEYQPAGGAKMFLNVNAPSLGYKVNDLAAAQKGNGTLIMGMDAQGTFLQNSFLIAGVNTSGDLFSVFDRVSKKAVLNGVGNDIVFFNDNGDIYRFGYEEGASCGFSKATVTWTVKSITVDSSSTLQKSITVVKSTSGLGSPINFTITYSLRQGEPFLRISTKGSVPQPYTAMVKFPLNSTNIDNIIAGTPYHWNSMAPMAYGTNTDFNATMWATHDFVMPRQNGNILAAIYHASTPAWTSVGNNLYGVVLRNTPGGCENYGAQGTDDSVHTQEYALRIPSGLAQVNTGQPLREARAYNTPMDLMAITLKSGTSLPPAYSLAMTTGNAMITTTKWDYNNPNALIVRVYQPGNTRTTSALNIAGKFLTAAPVSALELPLVNAKVRPAVSKSGSQYILNLPRAVASFRFQ